VHREKERKYLAEYGLKQRKRASPGVPFLIVAAIAILLLVGAGWYFSGLVVRPRLSGNDMTCGGPTPDSVLYLRAESLAREN
jgi:hypothetical protein